jgi:hypothetical protein
LTFGTPRREVRLAITTHHFAFNGATREATAAGNGYMIEKRLILCSV